MELQPNARIYVDYVISNTLKKVHIIADSVTFNDKMLYLRSESYRIVVVVIIISCQRDNCTNPLFGWHCAKNGVEGGPKSRSRTFMYCNAMKNYFIALNIGAIRCARPTVLCSCYRHFHKVR